MIKQGNKVISNTQIKILSSNEITKETIEKILTGEIVSHTHDGTYVKKDDPRLSDSRPASDVSAWAKNAIKPSYSVSEITGLSNVAKTGSYNDLSNRPDIPTVDVNKAYVDGALATKADLVSGKIPLSQLPEIPSPITVDPSLSSTSTNPVQNKVINTALGNKVDKVPGKGLSANDYTTIEKDKLSRIGWIVDQDSSIEYEEDKIKFSTHKIDPSSGATSKSSFYIDGANGSKSGLMTASDKNKLDGIATGANNYIHPATSGNKHIPAGGASGQILRWSSDGTAVWGADNNTTYSVVGANGSTGLVKNGSSVTNASGYTTCPIIGGVPYYKNTIYTLPTATGSILGGIKTGANITNSSGMISITKSNVTSALGYTPAEEYLYIDYITNFSGEDSNVTESQFNELWNAIKDNKTIKLKYLYDLENNIYADLLRTSGFCYEEYALVCSFGTHGDHSFHVGLTIKKQSDGDFILNCQENTIQLEKSKFGGTRFLSDDGSYRFLPKVSTTQSGMVNALPNDSTKFLDGKGNWSTVNTVLKPEVSDIFKRITNGGNKGTVTQAEWDILVAATPEVDKTYFFSVTEDFINDGIGMCHDKGFIARSTSNVDMFINGILPQYPQYLVGVSVDATTKAYSMIAYGSIIATDDHGRLSISSITANGDSQTSSGLTFTTKGDGSKALMDNGQYKNVLPYILPKEVANLTNSSTSEEIETAFGGKEQMYNFVNTIKDNRAVFIQDYPVLGSKVGLWPVATHVYVSTNSMLSLAIKGQFSEKVCGSIGLSFLNTTSPSSIACNPYKSSELLTYDPNSLITLPLDFRISSTYTSDQIKAMLHYSEWKSFYNAYRSQSGKPLVKLSVSNDTGNVVFYYNPIEFNYTDTENTINLIVTISGYGVMLTEATSGILTICITYNIASSTYSLNAFPLG